MDLEYRSCVVGVFTNPQDLVLVGERSDFPGSWQFPQGGIDPGESAVTALYREMEEEVGTGKFHVVGTTSDVIPYRFPDDLDQPIAKKYMGQSLQWFHVRFEDGVEPRVPQGKSEFRAFKWVAVEEAVEKVISWKRDAYVRGLQALGFKLRNY